MQQQHFVTKERLEQLKIELEELKAKRMDISKELEAAIQMGDLSENAAYDDAKEKQAALERKIYEMEEIITNASLIKMGQSSSVVIVGSKVKVKWDGKEAEFTIVGPNEADPGSGLISNESPLGQGFLGSKIGDAVEIEVPRGIIKYSIISIS